MAYFHLYTIILVLYSYYIRDHVQPHFPPFMRKAQVSTTQSEIISY